MESLKLMRCELVARATSSRQQGEILHNEDYANNYFRVEDLVHDPDNSSHVDKVGGSGGEFALNDISNHNGMTEAHEFGHLMGLKHLAFGPDSNVPTNKQDVNPGIMIARGTTSPDPKYNYPKGTVNGAKRLVRKENVQMISPHVTIDPKTKKGTIGKLTHEYYPKIEKK